MAESLHDVEFLRSDKDAPVLVVTNEAACRAAMPLLPPGWLVTTWPKAPKAIKKADWSPLEGRPVAVWPENSLPGTKVAHEIGRIIGGAHIISPHDLAPVGWDLSAPLPPTLTAADVERLIADSLNEPVWTPTPMAEAAPQTESEPTDTPHLSIVPKFRALGYKNGLFYFFSARTQDIHSFPSRDLRSGNGLRDLEPNDCYWAELHRATGRPPASGREGIDWKALADIVIAECYKKGTYNDQQLRARGVWLDTPASANDPQRVIAHLGKQILVDGEPVLSMAIKSRYFYPVDEPLLPDAPEDTPALTNSEGRDLLTLCKFLSWTNKASGDILAGVIATSCICGALQFRTHAWITGPAGSGKSYIMENIVAKALDGIGLHILANSSEAGIRRHLSHDARPAIYDEAEGEGEAGRKRRDMIIGFMRASSTETKARILLGSGGKGGESFPVRAQFILGSVGTALDRATDQTRCLLLTLNSRNPTTPLERADFAEHFAEMQDAVSKLPRDLSTRLLKRMIGLVHKVRRNAETFRRLIAQKYASSRVGDQLGTVLAGTYSLKFDDEATGERALKHMADFPFAEYATIGDTESLDEGNLLNHLSAHHLRVESIKGTVDRTVGELCAILAKLSPVDGDGNETLVDGVLWSAARHTLERVGIGFAKPTYPNDNGAHNMFWLANNHPALRKVFASSQFEQGYQPILLRVHGAKKSPYPRNFAGVSARAIMLPIEKIVR